MFKNAALLEETDRLKKFAYRLTRNQSDADDLVQSTLLRAMEKKHLFKELQEEELLLIKPLNT